MTILRVTINWKSLPVAVLCAVLQHRTAVVCSYEQPELTCRFCPSIFLWLLRTRTGLVCVLLLLWGASCSTGTMIVIIVLVAVVKTILLVRNVSFRFLNLHILVEYCIFRTASSRREKGWEGWIKKTRQYERQKSRQQQPQIRSTMSLGHSW